MTSLGSNEIYAAACSVWILVGRLLGIVLARRVSGCHSDAHTLKNHPSGHPIYCEEFLEMPIQTYN